LPIGGAADSLGNSERLSTDLKACGFECPCHKRVAIEVEQKAWRRIHTAPIGAGQKFLVLAVEGADEDASLFGHAAAHGEQKVAAVWKKLRPAVVSLQAGSVQFGYRSGLSTRRRNTVNRIIEN
jgi:hypothetical protein